MPARHHYSIDLLIHANLAIFVLTGRRVVQELLAPTHHLRWVHHLAWRTTVPLLLINGWQRTPARATHPLRERLLNLHLLLQGHRG